MSLSERVEHNRRMQQLLDQRAALAGPDTLQGVSYVDPRVWERLKHVAVPAAAGVQYATRATVAAGAGAIAGVGALWNTVWGGTNAESAKEATATETKKAESIGGYGSEKSDTKPVPPYPVSYLVVPLALLTVLVLARR